MISKRCGRCGKRIPIGAKCNCYSAERHKPAATDKYDVDIKQFYSTEDWSKARSICIANCFGLDLYSLFVLEKIEYGFTVHHITPLIDDYSQRIAQYNLIYLTESNHRLIHSLYETNYGETSELLRSLLQKFSNFLASGVCKNVLIRGESPQG